MQLVSFSIFLILFISYLLSFFHKRRELRFKTTLISRFKKKLRSKNKFREIIKVDHSEFLMADPNRNIKISIWDKENLLREKADIHRARLSKYGSSKLNEEMFFIEGEDKVYKYTADGEKDYI